MSEDKAIIKNADMPVDMQKRSLDCARDAINRFTKATEIAAYIKKEFDSTYGPVWHCVVGRNFGRLDDYTTYIPHYLKPHSRFLFFLFSYLTHESKHFIFFCINQMAILIFKC